MNALICRQNILFILISFFVLTFLSCSDDPSSPVIEEEISLASKTIGTSGGIIESDDISVSVPSGAFDTNYDISISEVSDDGGFGENTISGSYKIVGLPNIYSKPINIKIKYSGELSGNSFIAVGNNFFNTANSDTTFDYVLHEVIDSSGFLIGKLPDIPLEALEKSNNYSSINENSEDRHIKGITAYKESRTKNFVFHHPIVIETFMPNVKNIFEEIFDIISNDLELSFYSKAQNQTIIVRHFPDEKAIIGGYNTQIYFSLNLDYVLQGKLDEIKKGLGNIILALELISYGNLGYFQDTIESWAVEFFTDSEFKYPENFDMHFMEPFYGLQVYGDNSKNHAIGLASILKYLADDESLFGMKGLRKMHANLSEDIDPISALLKTVDGNIVDWLPDFYKKYLNGEIYDLPIENFINSTELEWNINTQTDTLKNYNSYPENNFRDLSAKIFKINLNYQPIDETYNMLLSLTGPITVDGLALVVFGIQNNESVYLETAYAQDFEIPNLKEYYDNNMNQFLVVLVNGLGGKPYLGDSDIDLTIKVGPDNNGNGPLELDYNRCELQLFVNKLYERADGSTFEREDNTGFFASGEMLGDRFVADYNENSGMFVGTVEVVLDTITNTISYADWTHEYTQSSPSSYHKTEITAVDLPLVDQNNGVYKISGDQTCIDITNYTYYQDFEGNVTTLQSIECNSSSFLEIRLYKE